MCATHQASLAVNNRMLEKSVRRGEVGELMSIVVYQSFNGYGPQLKS